MSETEVTQEQLIVGKIKWGIRLSSVLIVIGILAIIMAEILFIAFGAGPIAPMSALLPWIILDVVSFACLVGLVVYKFKKFPEVHVNEDRISRRPLEDIVMKLAVIGCALSTVIPAMWYAIYSTYIFTPEDGMIGWLLTIVALAGAIVATYSAWNKSSTLFLFLYFGFNFIVFSLFSVMSPVWVIITILSGMGIISAVKVTNSNRKFIPRLRSTKAKAMVIVLMMAVMAPIIAIFGVMPNYTNEYTLGTEKAVDEIEINFTWANATFLDNESYYWLTQADALEGVEVSLTLPVIYRFKGGCDNRSWDVPVMVNNTFEEVENIPIEDVDQLDYVEDGLLEEFSENLTASGIPVDYMPLLPKEKYYMYPNDANINRFEKTYAIMKEFISQRNLETKHRGIVVDTERDYSNFEESLALFWDEEVHRNGRETLINLVNQMKKDQFYWKTNKTVFDQEEYDKLVENKTTFVADATFQYHLDDFIDWDDEQQHFYEISIVPPTNWDVMGVMTYDKEENSEHNFYGYCRAIDYFFGEKGVPYLYSEDSQESIIKKFRIAQNYGFPFVGIWAATSECCEQKWIETGEGWCGGYAERFGWKALYDLCVELDNPEKVSFTFEGEHWAKWTYMHALQLVDLYLVGRKVYSGWPLNDEPRIRW